MLDKFHMMKYVNISVSHLLDSAQEVKSEIWECLNGRYKKRLQKVYAEILKVTEEGGKYRDVEGALGYFLKVNSKARVPFVTQESCFVNENPVL